MLKKAVAEAIGTFALVLIGTGAAVWDSGNTGVLAVGLAFGLTLMAMAYIVGTVSGAHINPAVSLAMFINKRLDVKEFVVYVVAQLIGATAATMTLRFLLSASSMDTANLAANTLAEGLSSMGGFAIETILTFFFVLVILTVTGKNGNGNMAGITIGLTLTAMILMGGANSGASLNPARSFAPALFTGGAAMSQLWLYTFGPLLGGAIAAFVAKYILDTEN